MNTADTNNKVKQIIGKAKSIPIPVYLLLVLNLVMLTSFACQDLSLHYMLGMVVFTVLFVTFVVQIIGQTCGCMQTPQSLISDRVQTRLRDLQQKFVTYTKTLKNVQSQSNTINTVIAILLVVYLGSILSSTIEIFLIVNVLYVLVFLPEYIDSWSECCQSCAGGYLDKIKYKK